MSEAQASAATAETVDHDHWFEPVADHLGSAYLRYSFTKGTDQEVDFLVEELGLRRGNRVLDVGCGPGRHAYALAERGIQVVGIDISRRFIDLAQANAPDGATFMRIDARHLEFSEEFDAAISLCQGGFGLVTPGEDLHILRGMARALRPGGAIVVSAFSSYFQLQHLEEGNEFDASTGVHHEVTAIKDEDGASADADLWTTCYTPRELRLLVAQAGLELVDVWSVEPGAYARNEPTIDSPEFLVVASRRLRPSLSAGMLG